MKLNSNQIFMDVLTSRIHVDRVLAEIDERMLSSAGTAEERKKQMQSLMNKLDQKLESEKQAIAEYDQVIRSITGPKAGVINRATFNKLSPSAVREFIQNGGKVRDRSL